MSWDLRLSRWCGWGFKSSGIWLCHWVNCCWHFERTRNPWWWMHHDPSKYWEPLTQLEAFWHDRKAVNGDLHWNRHHIPELLRKCFRAVLGRTRQTNIIHVSIILWVNNATIYTCLSFQMFSFPPLNAQSFTFLLKTIFLNYLEYSHLYLMLLSCIMLLMHKRN
jgi:hypothetical protein